MTCEEIKFPCGYRCLLVVSSSIFVYARSGICAVNQNRMARKWSYTSIEQMGQREITVGLFIRWLRLNWRQMTVTNGCKCDF